MASKKGEDKEFGPLKDRWLRENGYDGNNRKAVETKLYNAIVPWVNAFVKGMNNDGSSGLAGQLCEEMKGQNKISTDDEKKVCNFIAQNLWKIQNIRGSKCNEENVNKEMEEYVYCTIMTLWSTLYLSSHCDKENVISTIFKEMKNMNEQLNTVGTLSALSPGTQCEGCTYGNLEQMEVNTIKMLGYIQFAMKKNTDVMELINKEPRKPCPTQNNSVSGVGHSDKSSGVGAGNSADREPEGKKMSKADFKFITNLLVQWIKAKGIDKLDNFKDEIWKKLDEIFRDMMENIGENTETENTFCGMEEDNGIGGLKGSVEKELCKILIQIFFWINGLELKYQRKNNVGWQWKPKEWKKRESEQEKELQAYLRCLVGHVTLMRMLGMHCALDKVAEHVGQAVDSYINFVEEGDQYGKCKNVDVSSVRMGGRLIWEQLEQWINTYSRPYNATKGLQAVSKMNTALHRIKKKGETNCPKGIESKADTLELLGIHGGDKEPDIRKDTETWKKNALGEILKEADRNKEDVDGFQKKMESINDNLQQNFQESKNKGAEQLGRSEDDSELPPPPIQSSQNDDCTNKGDLCTRVNCVTKKWGINRGQDPTWNNMENDINNIATEMFKEISTNSTKMKSYCADKKTETDSRRVTAPEIKACHYITAGLQHIYDIEIDPSDLNNGDKTKTAEQKKKEAEDNRLFKQTVSCLVLNAYADRLKQLVKSPCEVSEQTIEQAFKKGNDQFNKGCMGKKNGYPCVECKWDGNYKNCKIGDKKETVGSNLDALLQKNTEKEKLDQDISSTFNSLCDRTQCVITQWTRDRREERKAQAKNIWENQSWNDIMKTIDPLAKAMLQPDTTVHSYCKGMKAEKEAACKQIVSGLKHIYNIEADDKDYPNHKENYRIFKQTMECFILNVYSDLIKEKCPEVNNSVQQFFNLGEDLHTTECNGNNKCDQCKWDSCAHMIFRGKSLREEIKKELEKKEEITQILQKICPKAAVKPPAAPSQTKVDQRSGDTETTQQIPGKDSAPLHVPAEPEPKEKTQHESNAGKCNETDSLDGGVELCAKNPIGEIGTRPGEVQISTFSTPQRNDDDLPDGIDPSLIREGIITLDPTPTHADSQTPSTGTDTETPSGSALGPVPQIPGSGEQSDQTKGTVQGPGASADGSGSQVPTETKQAGAVDTTSGTNNDNPSGPHPPTINSNPDQTSAGQGGLGGSHTSQGGVPPATSGAVPGPTAPVVPAASPSPSADESASVTTATRTPTAAPVHNKINPSDLTPYLPTIPVFLATSVISYLLWKYFFFGKKRKRYRRTHQVSGHPSLQEQIIDPVDDHDGPHEYTLVKKRRQPRSAPTKTKRSKKQGVDRHVCHRTIIDIHLEVLDECQKVDLHSTKEDFFEILVQEFTGSKFIEEEKVPKEYVPKEEVPSSDSGFREEDLVSVECVPEEDVREEHVPSSDSGFRV
ncbi:SICA antigen [Plasmodium coatneyi]|uniref:SICA antigen n=1 Tax=Plasmodium coatneyi TaxID=208452 RepID=A0A1B1E737_9APIC|nr:SICA antigen [Plasmodium coatneyi]ANQ10793.1 SICA antigen [Plasmodium coatneyi]